MTTPVGFADMSIEFLQTGDEVPYSITFGVGTDLATWTAVEHCNTAFAAFTANWLGLMDNDCAMTKCVGRFGQDGTDDLIVESDVSPVQGTATGARLPQNCALLVRKNTGLGGRKNRGRFYIPCALNEGEVDAVGVIAAGAVAAFQTGAEAFYDDLADGVGGTGPEMGMVILHRSLPDVPTDVISLTVDPVIATQRRRLRR